MQHNVITVAENFYFLRFSNSRGFLHTGDDRYNYHLKTALVYYDDAEQELEAIMHVDELGGIRSISEKEWKEIKDFFVRFCL